jgi:hypothetical protein
MATKRKSRSPRAYRDGGAVIPDTAATDVLAPEPALTASEPAIPEPLPVDVDAVRRVAEADRQAQEFHRQAAQERQAIDRHVDAIPDISDFKRSTLKAYPVLMQPEYAMVLSREWHAARSDGVPDDTPAMNTRILSAVANAMEAKRKGSPIGGVTEPAPMPEIERPEVKTLAPEIETEALAPFVPPPMPTSMGLPPPLPHAGPSRGKTMPVSAPVSRDVPTASGKRTSEMNSITLSPAEMEIARNSFGSIKDERGRTVDLTDAQKCELYARNKLRLAKMRASGEYRPTTEQSG